MNLLKKMAGMVFRASDPRAAEYLSSSGISESGEGVNAKSAMQVSTFWACVNLIAGTISTLPVSVTRYNGRVPETVNHPLNRILQHSPNADQTSIDFFDFLCQAIEVEGDGIAQKIRGAGGNIIGLVPLKPTSVSRTRLADGRIQYRWTREGRAYVETEENVLHIRGPGGDPMGGMSALAYGRDAIGLAMSAERVQNRMFRNGVRPTIAVAFETWLTPERREIANTKFAERFTGVENAGRPVILEGGSKVEKISIDPVDAEILMTRGFSVEEICRFFNMPPVMIGHTSKTTSWPTGVEAQFLLFLKLCLRRRVKRIEQAMEKQLLTPQEYESGLRIEFNFEGLLRADSEARASFYQIMTQIGGLTVNEMRELEGRKPVPGGDVVLVQMQNIPLEQAGKPREAAPQITQGDTDEDRA